MNKRLREVVPQRPPDRQPQSPKTPEKPEKRADVIAVSSKTDGTIVYGERKPKT